MDEEYSEEEYVSYDEQDELTISFNNLEENFTNMKEYCLSNGLDFLSSRDSYHNYILLSTIY